MSTEGQAQAEAPTDPIPMEGEVIAGKYRIEKVLGQGGMGVVVAAQHTALRQKVAIKFLLPQAIKRDGAVERFLREARAAVSIQSEHIAKVMDVGTLETGAPYMVMEYLTGSDLGVILHERGPLPISEAIEYILQAGEAIAEAHALGIVHRDLKPANLFVTRRPDGSPFVKVLDFGLSKLTSPESMEPSLTAANVVMGSPYYMSPEQIRSLKGLDTRTDIWALGVILYQLLCGVRPFDADSLGALFFTIGADAPQPLSARRPDVPRELEAAVHKCLEKDAQQRTQSVAELARAIAPFALASSSTSISLERIHGVLSDGTPLPAMRSSAPSSPDGVLLQFGTPLRPPSLRPSAPAAAVESAPPIPAAPASVPAQSGAMSGSMSAVARDGSAPPRPSAPSFTERPRRPVLIGSIVAAAFALGGLAIGLLRSAPHAPAADAAAHIAATAAPPAATPAPAAEAPSATATTEPAATAEAATSAVPTSSAAATSAPKTSKTATPKGLKPGAGKKKDALDQWK